MKRKHFAVLALGCFAAAAVAACTAQEDTAARSASIDADASASIRGPAAPPPEAGESRIAVVYFSEPETADRRALQGSTEALARIIRDRTGGALLRIERDAPYPSSHDALVSEARGERDRDSRPLIRSLGDLSGYDTIFLGYPIWWYDMPMPVYSFLETCDLSGKTIIPFVTHGAAASPARQTASPPPSPAQMCGARRTKCTAPTCRRRDRPSSAGSGGSVSDERRLS